MRNGKKPTRKQKIRLGQAGLIFRTNIQTAYNVGHYEQMTDPGVMKLRPVWQ